jgi:hypothetical protein
MNVNASPFVLAAAGSDTSLAALLELLASHDEKLLVLQCGLQRVQAGYHVTEVKAGSFVTLDCGGNLDAWQETILQVEDTAASEGASVMTVGKLRSILAQVDRKVRLNGDARLTFEVSRSDEAMRVYDVAGVEIDEERAIVHLGVRPAICKPRHRLARPAASACCAPTTAESRAACCG